MVLVAGSARGLAVMVELASWPRLVGAGLVIGAVCSLPACYLGLRKPERDMLRSLVGIRT